MEQPFQFGLDDKAPADRLRIWRDLMHGEFLEFERFPDPAALRGTLKANPFDGGMFARWPLSTQTVVLPPQAVKYVNNEYIYILPRAGDGVFEQNGEAVSFKRGDLHILDQTRAYRTIIDCAPVTQPSLKVPKSAIARRLGTHESCFGADAPLQRLAVHYLQDLAEIADQVPPSTLSALVEQGLNLIALVIAESRNESIEPSTHQAAMLLRIKLFLKANVKNPSLTIDQASAALGMSSRYINVLLSSEGTSFGRLLRTRRLEGACRDIQDPARLHRQIAEVAFDWGFKDVSHFGRLFKERYGMTPREAKFAAALVGTAGRTATGRIGAPA